MTSSGTQIQRFKFLADDGLNIFMHRPNCLPCQLVHSEFEFDLKTIFYFSHDELPRVRGHGPGAGQGGARRGVHLPLDHLRAQPQRLVAERGQQPPVRDQVRRDQGQQPRHPGRGQGRREEIQVGTQFILALHCCLILHPILLQIISCRFIPALSRAMAGGG